MKYILFALIIFSCNNIYNKDSVKVSGEMLDTVKTLPANLQSKPLLLEAAFIKGTTHKVRKSTLSFVGINIGKIKIGSGNIIACDPMNIDEYGIPFTQTFPTGEFPVQLSIAKMDDSEVIAFARIVFSDAAVERWEYAMKPGEKPMAIGGEKKYGYSTDSGTGVFIDETANKQLNRDMVTEFGKGIYLEMDKHAHYGWRYTMYDFSLNNLAAFSSGFGDGFYATYIGFDSNGKPCRLLTDFGLSG